MSSYGTKKIFKNSIFLKVNEGKPETVRLLDPDPTEQWQHKIGTKLEACGGEQCPFCEAGHSKGQRFVTNVYNHGEGKVQLWSYGPMVAEELKAIALALEKDEVDIMDSDLEITVKGDGLQKKTKVQPRMKSQPLPKGLKLLRIGAKEVDIPF